MNPELAVLVGALVGGGATFAATYFQSRSASGQQRVQTAAQLALREHDFDMQLRREGNCDQETYIAEYVAFHDAILRELEKGKGIDPSQIKELVKKYRIAGK